MLRSLKELERTTVVALDGDVGSVENFLFDDRSWIVRDLVVETGTAFQARRVLVAPASFRSIDWPSRVIHLGLTCQQIRDSASLEADVHAPSQREHAYLRSAQEVSGYPVQGSDDGIGVVCDFLVDDATWAIRYLVVDTGHWWAEHKVLIAPGWATRIGFDERRVFLDMTRDAIRRSPVWIEHGEVDRDYEARLHEHHGRAGSLAVDPVRIAHESEGAAAGAMAGTVVGASAGPPGMVAGAIVGAAVGAIAAAALDARAATRTRVTPSR